mmetsp:Transcript_14752/g.29890  ORF Transcript_14752/g.29890 Transcript_14752/m.29890 type:complete len:190 (-) Transcript_14752:225-794(-)
MFLPLLLVGSLVVDAQYLSSKSIRPVTRVQLREKSAIGRGSAMIQKQRVASIPGGIRESGRSRITYVQPRAFLGGNDPNSPIAKLKKIFKDYGTVALLFHFSVWSMTLASSYAAVSNGLPVAQYLPHEFQENIPGKAGDLAIAYLATEATGPVRTLLTLSVVPLLARKLNGLQGNIEGEEEAEAVSQES